MVGAIDGRLEVVVDVAADVVVGGVVVDGGTFVLLGEVVVKADESSSVVLRSVLVGVEDTGSGAVVDVGKLDGVLIVLGKVVSVVKVVIVLLVNVVVLRGVEVLVKDDVAVDPDSAAAVALRGKTYSTARRELEIVTFWGPKCVVP